MKLDVDGGRPVTLRRSEFVAAGAQGSVYARNDTAFKVFADPASAPPPSKLSELGAIGDPAVLAPIAALRDRGGGIVGYTMPFIANASSLAQLTTRAYRQRRGFLDADGLAVVDAMRQTMLRVHAAGVAVVDLSGNNVLVRPRPWRPCFIDTDSWQTPTHPATAVTPSIRDPHATRFDAASDWFAFAVVTFELLVGIHPFKGKHDSVRGLEARMQAGLSVFDPDVRTPRACAPMSVIPNPLRAWYRAIFTHAVRTAPPPVSRGGGRVRSTAPREHGRRCAPVRHARPPGGVTTERLHTYDGPVRVSASARGELFVATERSLYVGGRRVGACPPGIVAVAAAGGAPVPIGRGEDGTLTVDGVACGISADEITQAGGRVFARRGGDLFEVAVVAPGGRSVAAPRLVGSVMPRASALHRGVLIQSVLGATHATLLQGQGCPQVRLPQLDRLRVVDASYDSGVLVVLTCAAGAFDRWVFRFDAARGHYDHRRTSGVPPLGAVLATTDRGVCVLAVADGLEMFSATPGHTDVQTITLPVDVTTLLAHQGTVLSMVGRDALRLTYPHADPAQTG